MGAWKKGAGPRETPRGPANGRLLGGAEDLHHRLPVGNRAPLHGAALRNEFDQLQRKRSARGTADGVKGVLQFVQHADKVPRRGDRKRVRLNSSHVKISYAVFCLKKK